MRVLLLRANRLSPSIDCAANGDALSTERLLSLLTRIMGKLDRGRTAVRLWPRHHARRPIQSSNRFYYLRPCEGEVVFAKAGEFGLEGVMSKRAGSFYRSEKSRSWRAR